MQWSLLFAKVSIPLCSPSVRSEAGKLTLWRYVSLVLVAQKYILLDDGMKESERLLSWSISTLIQSRFFSLSQGSREEPGLIPLALEKILAEADKTSCSKVEVSYYQVYMDRCYNLLDPRVGEVSVFDSSQGGRVRLRGLNRVIFSLEISRSSAVVNSRSFQPKIPKIHILYINSFAWVKQLDWGSVCA